MVRQFISGGIKFREHWRQHSPFFAIPIYCEGSHVLLVAAQSSVARAVQHASDERFVAILTTASDTYSIKGDLA